ncbi:hypothetical protein DWB64_11080, partial [Fusibacter sp. A1]
MNRTTTMEMRTLALFIALLLLFSASPNVVFAAQGQGINLSDGTTDTSVSSGNGIHPIFYSGNDKHGIKGESVEKEKWHDYNGQIDYWISDDGRYLKWRAKTHTVASIRVKGGTDYYEYNYSGFVSGDSKLRSPLNKGGNIPQISHFNIVIGNKTPDETTAKPVVTQAPTTATPVVTQAPTTATPVVTQAPTTATPVVTQAPTTATPVVTQAPTTATPVVTQAPTTATPVVTQAPTTAT